MELLYFECSKRTFQRAAIPTILSSDKVLENDYCSFLCFLNAHTHTHNKTAHSVSPFLRAICVDL